MNDTVRMSSRNFKIASIINPLDAWTVPFKYDGRYCSSLTLGKGAISIAHAIAMGVCGT